MHSKGLEGNTSRGRVLETYLPRLLRLRLLKGTMKAPEASEAHGAVMLTDIEGFTSHVEHFAARGHAGLDILAAGLNGYFADLVAIVDEYGGDVLHIAGDAFFCWFPAASATDVGDSVRLAGQAALEIQDALHARRLGDSRSFATRIGISAGALRMNWVGGTARRWELVPLGAPLEEVANAEVGAPGGGVVVCPVAWKLIAGSCRGTERADMSVELKEVLQEAASARGPAQPAADIREDLLVPFVPAPVYHWNPHIGTDWLAEIRPLTVLMVRLGNLSGGSPTVDDLQSAVGGFQAAMARYEAEGKVVVDDKGVTLGGFFGLPPRAHSDDAERAVRASEAILEALRSCSLEASIGVATGRALCGVFGSDLRREYTVCGDVVNLASRLATAGMGGVVCDGRTADAARSHLAFFAMPEMSVKGRRGAVPIYRPSPVLSGSARVRRPSRVVGRRQELDQLAERVSALVAAGIGATLVIEGDAGLGKSRLLAEGLAVAADAGLAVHSVQADAIEHSTPYFAWRPLFSELLGLDREGGHEESVERLVDDFGLEPRLLPLLSSVTPLCIPDTELTAGMNGEVRSANINLLLTAFLQRQTEVRPSVLAVEDVHWLDSMSWSLLLSIVGNVPRLLTLVTMRPLDLPPSEYRRLVERPSTDVIGLDGLDGDATRELLADRLDVEHVPLALATFVQDRVAGHPFFCEELLSSLVEGGAVTISGTHVTVGELESLDLPSTVQGTVISRLDRLTAPEVLSAKVAAVIGRSFRSSTVAAAHPIPDERAVVPARLSALVDANLTVPEPGEEDQAYLFRHEITREVTYDLITSAQRRPMHRSVAEWYEAEFADDLTVHFPVLAHHWSRAEEPEKAISYLERSGEQALRNGAFAEARRFFSQALKTQEQSGLKVAVAQRASWSIGLGTAHYFLGNLTDSRRLLEEAVGILDRPIPQQRALRLAAILGQLLVQTAHRVTPSRFLGRRAHEKETLDQLVACYRSLAQIYYLDGDTPDALVNVTLAGLNRGEEAGDSPELARVLVISGGVAGIIGLPKLAETYCAQAIRMAEKEDKYDAASYVWHMRAIALAQPAKWKAALEANDRALALIRQLGDFNLEAEAWQVRAAINICEGDYEAASQAWRETYRLGDRNGNQQVRCWALLDQAQVLLATGDVEGAAAALDFALEVPTVATDGTSAIEKLTVTALTRLLQGRPAEAVQAADAAVDMVARQPPTSFNWVDFCAQAGEVYLALVEEGGPYGRAHRDQLLARARRAARQVQKVTRRFWGSKPRLWLLRGMVQWLEGDQTSARKAWEKAEAEATRLGLPFELARAQLETARHSPFGPAQERRLEAAMEAFAARGALLLLARAAETAPCPAEATNGARTDSKTSSRVDDAY